MELSRIRETVFEHEEGRDTATITAAEPWSVNRLKRLAEEYPELVTIHENHDGSIFAHVPWKWMKLKPPVKVAPRTEAQLQALAEGRNRR